MIIALQILGGLLLLFLGGEVLVRGAVALAKGLGLSSFVIGLTVVAYGTSSPEMVISTQAALTGHPDIALGNVVGSNISNILCVLGLTAIIYPIAIDKKLGSFDGLFMLIVTCLLFGLLFLGTLNYIAGSIFLTVLVIYTFMVFKKARESKDLAPEAQTAEIEGQIKIKLNLWQSIAACLVGLVLLTLGGNTLIGGAVSLAKIAGLSEAAIALTIVAFGSSLPELITSVVAAYRNNSEIAFGNIIGSNLFNILGILGVTSMLAEVPVSEQFMRFDMPILLVVTLSLFAIILYMPKISRSIGVLYFSSYIAYVAAQFV